MSSYSSSDEEDNLECPLCMEEIDLADKYFKPCVCGYQICRFCWHHIKEDLNGLCPGCRREYTEEMVQFKPVSPEKLAQLKAKRKAKKREKKEHENNVKKHYANVRVIQKNLVYVIGLPSYIANEETIKQYDYFGQYGKITKVVINKKTHSPHQTSVGVYITYSKKEEAQRAIEAVDNSIFDGYQVKASYGTTKYCTFYLRGQTCQNPQCMYLHEPGEEIESKEELLSKTQVLTSQSSLSHVKEVKQPVPPKAIRTTIYREKDETSALPASANWGSRNGKTRHDDGEKKVISINLSDLLSKTNENSKVNSINLSRSKSDSHSSQKIKTESKTKLNPPIKSQSIINLTSFKNELNDENSHHEKISNNNRDEEYPALSTLLSKKNNHSKEGHSSSHSSLIMSPQSSHSKLISRNNSKETINNDETTSKTAVDENNLINNKDNDTVVNEETTENIPRTESPIPEKEEIEIISEEKSEIENDIKEASKKSILEEISKAYSYDQVSTNTNITSSPIKSATTISSSFNLFTKLSKNPSESSKEGKTKSTNSPPPGFESKMESKMLSPNISKSDLKANDNYLNLNQSITDLKISDDEIISDNSNHINEFKYNGPFDPFNEVLNNLMNVNTIMSDYYRHYPQGFGGFNEMYNNEFNGMNQMSSLINGSNFAQYQNHLNKKYFDQYYQNLNREQIQNNLKAMLPNINISPYSNGNENNPWSNQHSQNGFNDNLFNSYNSLATTLNGNNMFFNNINNNIDFIKQYQMTQMLNNMKKTQQMENNMSMSNNINMNNYQDFKSLPFKDSAIMAVKMGNVNNDNSNQDSKNMNSMNLFQNLNMKPNEIANNAGFSINPVSPINAFANLNQLNNINGMNDIANLNGINSLNNNINSVNQLHNVQQMSNFNDITAMNMNLVSPSLSSSIIPNFDTINKTNFKSMNEFNNEGLTGLTGSANTMYENDMNFFQKLSQINKDGVKN